MIPKYKCFDAHTFPHILQSVLAIWAYSQMDFFVAHDVTKDNLMFRFNDGDGECCDVWIKVEKRYSKCHLARICRHTHTESTFIPKTKLKPAQSIVSRLKSCWETKVTCSAWQWAWRFPRVVSRVDSIYSLSFDHITN